MFYFVDRMGRKKNLLVHRSERLIDVIKRERIPLNSVIIMDEIGNLCNETQIIQPDKDYYAYLIEGYDISTILKFIDHTNINVITDHIYFKRRLFLSPKGDFEKEELFFNNSDLIKYVEQTFFDTCKIYNIINSGDKIILGLSGGVDSSSLLILLTEFRKKTDFEITAVTFQDFDSYKSPTLEYAQDLTKKVGIQHFIVNANVIEEIFHLNTPLRSILPTLMGTPYAHFVMYIDHHTTRRALEYFAEKEGINKISLGLHSSDILGGLLNSFISGYEVGDLPKRKIGNFEYIYPLLYLTKKELCIYHYLKTQTFAKHSTPNPWEIYPKDRNFYYYLADLLQEIWPGIENYIFEGHMRKKRENPLQYEFCCGNCSANILMTRDMINHKSDDLCDVCKIFKENGYIYEVS